MRMYQEKSQLTTGDMSPKSLRHYGHMVVDMLADYLEQVEDVPVLPSTSPGTIRESFHTYAPAQPEAMENILADIRSTIIPNLTQWSSPGFMGYFSATSSAPSVLADMFEATFNVTRMIWRTSPAATEIEQVTLQWLRHMLGLPETFFGTLHHNSAIVHALVAAREAIPSLNTRVKGLSGRREVPRLRIYASQEAHSCIDKAAVVIGLGLDGLCKIRTDSAFRMDVQALEESIQRDIQAGYLPFAVVATVGTTSTTSIDPVAQIATICERYGLWLHVDAAYAGAAALVSEKRWVIEGCERADSFSVNPHKWLFTSFGCSVLYTRHPALLKTAFSLTPDYLQNPEEDSDAVPNLMDYDYMLPHGFPALKLWMVIRYFGHEGLAARIAEHCRIAQQLASWIDSAPEFERLAPTPLSVVCFRAHPLSMTNEEELDVFNERLMETINTRGNFFLSHTRILGAYAIRVSIMNIRVEESHIRRLWLELQTTLQIQLDAWYRQQLVKRTPRTPTPTLPSYCRQELASGGVLHPLKELR